MTQRLFYYFFLFLLGGGLPVTPCYSEAAPSPVSTIAKQMILVETKTGKVLAQTNADQLMHPSSMSKIMTIFLVLERLKSGETTREALLPVSAAAHEMEGSRMFVEQGSMVSIHDLLQGSMTSSGNDSCAVLAEGFAGTESAFSKLMTQRAKELGATQTTFKNASGLPDPQHLTTARDLMILSRALIQNFPEYEHLWSQKTYCYNNITQHNRNKVLWKSIGCYGIKTGHTSAGGYGIVATARQDGLDVILVLNGLPSKAARTQESVRLLTWAFQSYTAYRMFKAQQLVTTIPLKGGHVETVPVTVAQDCVLTVPKGSENNITVSYHITPSLQAPIARGQEVGTLEMAAPSFQDLVRVPLVAAKGIEAAGFFQRIWRWIRGGGRSLVSRSDQTSKEPSE